MRAPLLHLPRASHRSPFASRAPVALRSLLALAALAPVALAPAPARAHEFRPGSLAVTAAGQGRYDIEWSPPPDAPRSQLAFPPHCTRSEWPSSPRDPEAPAEQRLSLDCGPAGLAGCTLAVTNLAPLRDEVLVRVRLERGAELTATLTAARPSLEIPPAAASASAGATVASFALTGAGHLLTGLDHVLFVLGLLLIVRSAPASERGTGRRPLGALVRAVTAFTLAHSLTLALQVLGAVSLPPAPVEAAIALSVLFLAREILRPPARPTLVHRRPWIAAFAFGLLHGLGFAGALASHDLPRAQLPAALLGFNLGLEAAQLALLFAALALARAARLLASRVQARRGARASHDVRPSPPREHTRERTLEHPPSPLGGPAPPAIAPARALAAYAIGGVAAFWLLSRVAAFWIQG